jgi:hypothetical protein
VKVEIEPEMEAFLHSGCALVVGLASITGEPYAARGWGVTVLDGAGDDAAPLRLRLLLDSTEEAAAELIGPGCEVALTATDVRTVRSVQFKGRATGLVDVTEADQDRADAYCDDFFADVVTVDNTPRELVERMRPTRVMACTVELHELFDQTPGPGAGSCLRSGTP